VRYGLLEFLLPHFTSLSNEQAEAHLAGFCKELESGEVEAFMERLKAFFANISDESIKEMESRFHAILYMVFTLVGKYSDAEARSDNDRFDAVVKTKDFIYVFELGLKDTAKEALQHIDSKNYSIPYQPDDRKLVKIGAKLSEKERNIHSYLVG